jgi:hypothetical protein
MAELAMVVKVVVIKVVRACFLLLLPPLLSTRDMHTHEAMKKKTSASYAADVYSEA